MNIENIHRAEILIEQLKDARRAYESLQVIKDNWALMKVGFIAPGNERLSLEIPYSTPQCEIVVAALLDLYESIITRNEAELQTL